MSIFGSIPKFWCYQCLCFAAKASGRAPILELVL